jgi:isoamylase
LASINYVTAHDGFTLHDLVSYERKHNLANGENNTDGTDQNFSWNSGVDGPSDNAGVRALRFQQKRNLMATLLLSLGVPMLAAGDELGRSQNGNNNAYCQDNETSWIEWLPLDDDASAFLRFVQRIIRLRRGHAALRRDRFFTGEGATLDARKDIVWLRFDGKEMRVEDWINAELRHLGCAFEGTDAGGQRYALMLNAEQIPVRFTLPRVQGGPWQCLLDTSAQDGLNDTKLPAGAAWTLAPRCLVLFAERR